MYDATSFNAQRGNVQNERKSRQVENSIRLGETFFISEIQSSYDPPQGATLLSASGRQVPTGGLNYIVPDNSTLYYPTLPADVTGALQGVGRPSSYKGLWRDHVRYPVDLGNVNGVQVYGIHAKSAPSINQQYALAGMILDFADTVGGDWALIGDLNLAPATLSMRINELRPGAAAALYFVSLGRSTHSGGLELDYVVTNRANTDIQQISRMNLRRGSDHSGIGVTFN